jgi:hypothetical protein
VRRIRIAKLAGKEIAMHDHTAYDFNPQMSPKSEKLFELFRLVSIGAFLFALAVASFMVG